MKSCIVSGKNQTDVYKKISQELKIDYDEIEEIIWKLTNELKIIKGSSSTKPFYLYIQKKKVKSKRKKKVNNRLPRSQQKNFIICAKKSMFTPKICKKQEPIEEQKKSIKDIPRKDGTNIPWKKGRLDPIIPPDYRGTFQEKE